MKTKTKQGPPGTKLAYLQRKYHKAIVVDGSVDVHDGMLYDYLREILHEKMNWTGHCLFQKVFNTRMIFLLDLQLEQKDLIGQIDFEDLQILKREP